MSKSVVRIGGKGKGVESAVTPAGGPARRGGRLRKDKLVSHRNERSAKDLSDRGSSTLDWGRPVSTALA